MAHDKNSQITNDYTYPISVAGAGVLGALAVFLILTALNHMTFGLLAAGAAILITVFIFLKLIKVHAQPNVQIIQLSGEGDVMGGARLITSLTSGAIIGSNEVWKGITEKIDFDIHQDKINLASLLGEDETTFIRELNFNQKAEIATCYKTKENKSLYFDISAKFDRRSDDIVIWHLKEKQMGDVDKFNQKAPDLESIGVILTASGNGIIHLDHNHDVIFTNEIVKDWITDKELKKICSDLSKQKTVKCKSEKAGRLNISSLDIYEDEKLYLVEKMPEPAGREIQSFTAHNKSVGGFFKDSLVAIAVIRKDGKIIDKNTLFTKFSKGLEVGRVQKLSDMIEKSNEKDTLLKIKQLLKTGEPFTIDDVKFLGDSDYSGGFYVTKMDDFAGTEQVAVIYLKDTTEQKNLELQFAQSQKMQAVGQLAGGIAHDFNNLLTAILGFCDLLFVRHAPGDQSFSDIYQIQQNAARAANLVRQLLAFSRQQTLKPKVLNLTDVLAELSNLLRRLIGEKIDLSLKHGRNIGAIKVDVGQLEQVIINLCVNARDAMPDGGQITIQTSDISIKECRKLKKEDKQYKVMPTAEYVLIQVEDTGTGIPLNIQTKIFEPFFSTKEVGKGTGLGLSTVYGIVKQTGGFIFLESEMDKGTIFKIYLPLHKEEKTEDEIAEEVKELEITKEKKEKDLTGRERILLVEDEDAVRMFATRALKNKGYEVLEADCGEAAIQIFSEIKEPVDLVITDVIMPGMDGPTMIRQLKKDIPDLKVIFISGYAEDAFDAELDGDFNFLPKPFSLAQLAEKVKEVLSE